MEHRALALPLLILAVAARAQEGPLHLETRLGTLPARWREAPKTDPSGWHLAGIAGDGEKVRVWFDGKAGPAYTSLANGHPVLSPRGGRFAYDACVGPWEGGEHHAVVDGVPGPAYDALKGPEFAVEGRRVWYLGWRGRQVVPVVDGVAGPAYDEVEGVEFFAEGRHAAYRARRGGKWLAVLDGAAGPEYQEVDAIAFLPELGGFTYRAREEGKSFLVVGGSPQAPYDEIGTAVPVATPGGKAAYTARRGDRWFLVVAGAEGPSGDGFGADPAVAGGRLCCTLRRGGKWHAVAGDYVSPGFDEVRFPEVTPRGGVAYAARDGEEWLVAAGEAVGRGYAEVHYGSPAIGARGSVAFIVRKGGKWLVWRDGEEGPSYDRFAYYGKEFAIGFSEDGDHLAYVAQREGRWVVVLDGRESTGFDDVGVEVPLFAPGAAGPTYSCSGGGRSRMVLAGVPQPDYDEVRAVTAWEGGPGPRLAAYVARRGQSFAVVAGGKVCGWYDEVDGVVAAPGGGRVAFAARKGERWLAVVDGVEWPESDGFAQGPAFAASGPGAVCLAKYGEKVAILRDGRKGPLHDAVLGPYAFPVAEGFGPDGRRFAYVARDGAGWAVVVDGLPGPAFTAIAGDGPPRYREDGRLEYLAIRNQELVRVVVGAGRP